jgi:phospholipase C
MHHCLTKAMAIATAAALSLLPASPAFANRKHGDTATPIKHLVIIFQENVSFDHYFGTYPVAPNPQGEPEFHARPGTPGVNGLSGALLTLNPNGQGAANGAGTTNPFRLKRSQAATADQNHAYGPEQAAVHLGLMDLFPSKVGTAGPPPNAPPTVVTTKGLTMGYYDGNTVTAYWNYAQHFAMSDNSYNTIFGPSTPGLMNLVAGQTNGLAANLNFPSSSETDGGSGTLSVVGDPDPIGDVCSAPTRNQVTMASKNIGDLLNAAGVSWGSFMGGFDLTIKGANGIAGCSKASFGIASPAPNGTADYIAHHAFFQYWTSTANPAHTRPANISEIGHNGPANHNYDINDFFAAVKANKIPAVSFLKAPAFQDGHAGYSDPLDEQTFVVSVINALMTSPAWEDTAVVIAYDDSDGWYDHQMGPIVNQSLRAQDSLTGPGACGDGTNTALSGPDPSVNAHAQGRCGYGPRLPLIVVSPWAKENYVDHTVTDQTSITRFIEDNWLESQRLPQGSFDAIANSIDGMFDFDHDCRFGDDGILVLDPSTGQPVKHHSGW